jgi:hypothetical protein
MIRRALFRGQGVVNEQTLYAAVAVSSHRLIHTSISKQKFRLLQNLEPKRKALLEIQVWLKEVSWYESTKYFGCIIEDSDDNPPSFIFMLYQQPRNKNDRPELEEAKTNFSDQTKAEFALIGRLEELE